MNDTKKWNCSLCTFLNPSSSSFCSICGTKKENKNNEWQCKFCTFINHTKSSLCTMCGGINQSPSSSQQQSEKNEDESQIKVSNKEIDFKLFASPSSSKCNASSNIDRCSYLMRIAAALKYYEVLSASDKDSNGRDIFIAFCLEQYASQCLEDYIHFITVHSDIHHLKEIGVDLAKKYNLAQCSSIHHCKSMERHRRNRTDTDDSYNFYVDIFDTIHFQLFHLEHSGFRVLLNDVDDDDDKNNNDYFNLFDPSIRSIQNEMENRRKKYGLQSQNEENSKYNIIVATKGIVHCIYGFEQNTKFLVNKTKR